MVKCEGHDAVVEAAGAAKAALKILESQNAEIFVLIREMSADLREALTRAQFREDAIAEIDSKIENGLKSSVAALTIQVGQMVTCNDRRKREREDRKTEGLLGMLRIGWIKFKAQVGFIIICTGFIIIVWSISWIIQKAAIFHELPWGLFKLFGMGG
jgi:hypothetical protein